MIEIFSFVFEVVKCLASALGCQFGDQLRNCKSNFDELGQKVDTLKIARKRVQDKVDIASNNADEIKQEVLDWQDKVELIIKEADELIRKKEAQNGCFKANLMKRHKQSEEASTKVQAITTLILEEEVSCGEVFKRIFPQEIWHTSTEDYEALNSRNTILENILKALNDASLHMVGIYGMGGIGKTTLAMEVDRQVCQRKFFEKVVFVEISETPDIEKIQRAIADKLNLEFKNETERANRLYKRLRNGERILLILDNIWTDLELKTIGIPSGDDRGECKLLLTSRLPRVLRKMGASTLIPINNLSEEDAWKLFKKMAGDHIESEGLKPQATGVVKQCGGLPIAIVTVAKALREERDQSQWIKALEQLTTPSPKNFDGEHGKAYNSIKLSYDKLRNDEMKRTFLLCSLIKSPATILDLLKYGMGLDIFEDIYTMKRARDKVDDVIRKLKDVSLLLDGHNNELFLMHDFVREVAISIAKTDEQVFHVRNQTDWEWRCIDNYKKIFIDGSIIGELPEGLKCLQLESLHLKTDQYYSSNGKRHAKVPEKFFEGMVRLKVLDLIGMQLFSLKSSLHHLENLQTLCLDYCQFEDVAIIGELRQLLFLSFRGSNIKQLPSEIGRLTLLKLLDLTDCHLLRIIAPNVISNLSRLEELYMTGCLFQENNSLDELKRLHQLTTLEINITDDKNLPEDLFSKELQRYKISIGDHWYWFLDERSSRTLKLKFSSNTSLEELQGFKNVEELYLDELKGVKKNILYELTEEGLPELKHLHIQNNPSFQHIFESRDSIPHDAFPLLESLFLENLVNLKKICPSQLTKESFRNLKRIEVQNCGDLENVFSFSHIECLPHLENIRVSRCQNMKEILAIGSDENGNNNEVFDKVELCQLRYLSIGSVPQFASFDAELKKTAFENSILEDTPTSFFNKKVVFPNLEFLNLYEINSEMIWDIQLPPMSSFSQNLTTLWLADCKRLKYAFPSSLVSESFQQLRELQISTCSVLQTIVAKEDGAEADPTFVFSRVTSVWLSDLPDLEMFYPGEHTSKWPMLKHLEVNHCDKLKSIFNSEWPQSLFSVDKVVFPKLEVLELRYMNVEKIWACHEYRETMASPCPNLTRLVVDNCQKLEYLFLSSMVESLEQLQHLEVKYCSVLKEIVGVRRGAESATCEFVFSGVTFLKFWHLPELTTFYPTTHTSKWPILKELKIGHCDKVNVFIDEYSEESHFHISRLQALFVAQKINPKLEKLTLGGKSITMISQAQFPQNHFSKLKVRVKGDESRDASLLIPTNLENLCLSKSSYKEIFSHGKYENYDGTSIQLKVLKMKNLFALKNTWKEDSKLDCLLQNLEILKVEACLRLMSLVPSSASFQNLMTLKVSDCYGLSNLITSSTTKSLNQLREMKIANCMLLIEVVANDKDVAKEEIVFNKLKLMSLEDLESLISFCSGNHTFIFPSLDELIIRDCPSMKNFSGGVISAPKLQKVSLFEKDMEGQWDADLNTTIQNLHKVEVDFQANSNSEDLTLTGDNIRMTWQGQFPEHYCSGLKVLKIIKDESSNIPLGILERFSNLEVFILKSSFYKEIFSSEGGEKHDRTVIKIKKLELWGLFDLKQLWQQDSQLDLVFQNLETLNVLFCHNLINLVPKSASFENLTYLAVGWCDGLRNLLTSSMAKTLVQLETLTIVGCEMMFEIVENKEDQARDDVIVFNNLEKLQLGYLESLSSFCSGNYSFNFPALEELIVENCPKMKVFSEGVLSTPKLCIVMEKENDDEKWCWEGDLNTTIQQLYKKKMKVPSFPKDLGEASTQSPI